MQRLSIRRKILWYVLGAIIFALCVSFVFVYITTRSVLLSQVREDFSEEIEMYSSEVEELLVSYYVRAEQYAAALGHANSSDYGALFKQTALLETDVIGMALVDNGVERVRFGDVVIESFNEKSVVFGSDENGEVYVRVGVPVRDMANGSLFVRFSAKRILEVVERSYDFGETSEVIVITSNDAGVVQALHPLRFDSVGDSFANLSGFERDLATLALRNNSIEVFTNGDFVDYRGNSVFAAVGSLPVFDLGLVFKKDSAEVLMNLSRITQVFMWVLVLLIVLAGFFSYVVSGFLARPILELTKVAQAVGKGDLSQRIRISSQDEFGLLARVFNSMLTDLSALYARLEQKVFEKTQELQMQKHEAESQAARLDLAAEVGGVGVWDWDVKNDSIALDPIMAELLGVHEPSFDKTYNAFVSCIHPASRAEFEKVITTALETAEDFDVRVAIGDENEDVTEENVIHIRAKVFQDVNNITYRVVGVAMDVTQETRVDRAKTEFVSLASHQLRTPLTTIKWYAEMLLADDFGPLNEEQKKYIENIAVGNERLLNLINALLDVSRLELGVIHVRSEMLNISDFITSLLSEFQAISDTKSLDIHFIAPSETILASFDQYFLHIVLHNVVSNAVKYTPEKGRILTTVRTFAKEEKIGGQKVSAGIVFSVADTGFGIPKDQYQKVFAKMTRANNVERHDVDGTGLGLYMVKQIVTQTGGKIWFESEEEKGTTFYVWFPEGGMRTQGNSEK